MRTVVFIERLNWRLSGIVSNFYFHLGFVDNRMDQSLRFFSTFWNGRPKGILCAGWPRQLVAGVRRTRGLTRILRTHDMPSLGMLRGAPLALRAPATSCRCHPLKDEYMHSIQKVEIFPMSSKYTAFCGRIRVKPYRFKSAVTQTLHAGSALVKAPSNRCA